MLVSLDGFVEWNIFGVVSASEFGFRGGPAGCDGWEEEEENDIEPRIGEAIPNEEAEAHGWSGITGDSAEKRESPDSDIGEPHHPEVLGGGVWELGAESPSERVEPQVRVSERDHQFLERH